MQIFKWNNNNNYIRWIEKSWCHLPCFLCLSMHWKSMFLSTEASCEKLTVDNDPENYVIMFGILNTNLWSFCWLSIFVWNAIFDGISMEQCHEIGANQLTLNMTCTYTVLCWFEIFRFSRWCSNAIRFKRIEKWHRHWESNEITVESHRKRW